MRSRARLTAVALSALAFGFGPALSDTPAWPDRPLTMVVPLAAGSGIDVLARVLAPRLSEILGQTVVVDMRSPYVCLGTLTHFDELFLEIKNADLHDLRDTQTTRENYVASSVRTGIKRNRKRVLLVRAEIVAVSRLEDIVEN